MLLVVILSVVAYFAFFKKTATEVTTLPATITTEDLVEDIPEINPAENANPFSDGYKNPFE